MENKTIIIILVAVIVALAAILGVMILQPNSKEPTDIKITSNETQYEGGKLSIQLTDLNGTELSDEKVNIEITNDNKEVAVNETVKTNSKGEADLDLDLGKGNYTVKVSYGGNENYTGGNATQKLTIKEVVKETKSYPKYNPALGYYRSTGIGQDEWGVVELANGQYVVIAGDGYFEYEGMGADGYPIKGREIS